MYNKVLISILLTSCSAFLSYRTASNELLPIITVQESAKSDKQKEKEAKEQAKREERARKEAEKRAREEYIAQLNSPSITTLPIDANKAGLIISEVVSYLGYTFVEYKSASEIFGTETAQIALFTTKASWSESFELGYSSPARTLGNSMRYVVFGVSSNIQGKAVVNSKIGLITQTYAGYYYIDKTSVEWYRKELNSILTAIENKAEEVKGIVELTQLAGIEAYQQVKIGMSQDEVFKLLGKGKVLNETETVNLKVEEYEWSSGSGKISITFENGKVSKKSQSGLK